MKCIEVKEWFKEMCKRLVGDGKDTGFWKESWGDFGTSLKELFQRLYRLEARKDVNFIERIVKNEEGVCYLWEWERVLLDRDLVKDLEQKIGSLILKENVNDRWVWVSGKGEAYSKKRGV